MYMVADHDFGIENDVFEGGLLQVFMKIQNTFQVCGTGPDQWWIAFTGL